MVAAMVAATVAATVLATGAATMQLQAQLRSQLQSQLWSELQSELQSELPELPEPETTINQAENRFTEGNCLFPLNQLEAVSRIPQHQSLISRF